MLKKVGKVEPILDGTCKNCIHYASCIHGSKLSTRKLNPVWRLQLQSHEIYCVDYTEKLGVGGKDEKPVILSANETPKPSTEPSPTDINKSQSSTQ